MVTPELVGADRAGRHDRLPHRLRRAVQRRQVAPRRRRAVSRGRRRRARHRHPHRHAGRDRAALRPRHSRARAGHGALRPHRPAPGGGPGRRLALGADRLAPPRSSTQSSTRPARSRGATGSSTCEKREGVPARRSAPWPSSTPPRSTASTTRRCSFSSGQERAGAAVVLDHGQRVVRGRVRQRRELPRPLRPLGGNADAGVDAEGTSAGSARQSRGARGRSRPPARVSRPGRNPEPTAQLSPCFPQSLHGARLSRDLPCKSPDCHGNPLTFGFQSW